MPTNAELFASKLADPEFMAAFEAAAPAERQKMLDKAGLHLSLKEAETVLEGLSGGLGEDELKKASGGGYGFVRPPADPNDP